MKNKMQQILGMALLLALGFAVQSCEDTCEETARYIKYEPVYMLPDEMRAAVKSEEPRTLEQPGKIYRYGDLVLVNERLKGIHVLDNSNPENPEPLAFINIPGNVDMAIKDGVLFADSYIDLLCIDLSNPTDIEVLSRVDNAFEYSSQYGWIDPDLGIVVEWEEREIVEFRECDMGSRGPVFMEGDMLMMAANGSSSGGGGGAPNTGIGGSMARFTLVGNYLYAVGDNKLYPFNVTDASSPSVLEEVELDWGVETIFPYRNHLFIGTQTGMHIFGLQSPAFPSHVSSFQHIRSCDPVVVQGDYAYVTLRSDNAVCGGFTNQLEVVNISELDNPRLEGVYPMTNPHGLGIDGDCLFICEGDAGLRFLDASNPLAVTSLGLYDYLNAYDVIPYENLLMVIGEDGLYQYTYDCETAPSLISMVPIVRPN